jgi:glycosyltransferase involved in cell wall biosynthesis
MKILIIASDKGGRFAPFIEEQVVALEAHGVQIIRYGVTGHGIMGYLRELPALRRLIRAERPDIVHAHYGLSGLLANLQRLVPVVTTYHGSDINLPHILRLSKIAMRLSAHNIFVSARSANIALGLGVPSSDLNDFKDFKDLKEGATGKHTLLPCGVNLTDDQLLSRSEARQALGIADDAQIVLFAGAFDNAVKDAPLAQEAVTMIAPNSSNDLKDLKDHKDLKEGAPILQELRGFSRAEVNHWMCAANCLLMTSKTEGSPQVIKEAMACGCPIVSVDVGDVAERVSGVEGCYVVRTREPKDIAEALQKALAYEGKTNGRERILEMGLSNDQVVERLIAIYQSLV